MRGPMWDRLLREYYFERVFVDITVERLGAWPDLGAAGEMEATGVPWPGAAAPQPPPKNGTGPRAEGAGYDAAGLRLLVPGGLLPPGARRAGMVAHAYRPQLVGLSTRVFTGWLDVSSDGTAVYAPHTSKGFVAPPRKKLLLVSNGLFAKYGTWQARRRGTAERLKRLGPPPGSPRKPRAANP